MEKNSAPKFPALALAKSRCPVSPGGTLARSNLSSKRRCVVSAWVSTISEERCSASGLAALAALVLERDLAGAEVFIWEVCAKPRPATNSVQASDLTKWLVIMRGAEALCNFTRLAVTLRAEQVFDRLHHHITAHARDGTREGNALGARLHAVLRVAALVNAAITHQRMQPVFLKRRTRGMVIEKCHLRNGGRTDEVGLFGELRADFHANSAGDAIRQRIGFFLFFLRHPWAGAKIIGAVNGNPRLYALQI